MKTINPEQEITVTLPAHMLITLLHCLNISDETKKKLIKKTKGYASPFFYKGQSRPYFKARDIIGAKLGFGHLRNVCYAGSIKHQLNSELEAEVIGDKIKVGCQEFEIDKIRELIKKIDES